VSLSTYNGLADLRVPIVNVPGVAQVEVIDRVPKSGNAATGQSINLRATVETYIAYGDLTTWTSPDVWVSAFKWLGPARLQWVNLVRSNTRPAQLVHTGGLSKHRDTISIPLPGIVQGDKIVLAVWRQEWPGLRGSDVSRSDLQAEIKANGTKSRLFIGISQPFPLVSLDDGRRSGLYGEKETEGMFGGIIESAKQLVTVVAIGAGLYFGAQLLDD